MRKTLAIVSILAAIVVVSNVDRASSGTRTGGIVAGGDRVGSGITGAAQATRGGAGVRDGITVAKGTIGVERGSGSRGGLEGFGAGNSIVGDGGDSTVGNG